LGVQFNFQMLQDAFVTAVVERTKTPGWGLQGGQPAGIPNNCALRLPDGSRTTFGKATRLKVPKGATLELTCGGGGGYGPAEERDAAAVQSDVREGYVTEAKAREQYPHAFGD
jgi:N-methylhydantoinase B